MVSRYSIKTFLPTGPMAKRMIRKIKAQHNEGMTCHIYGIIKNIYGGVIFLKQNDLDFLCALFNLSLLSLGAGRE